MLLHGLTGASLYVWNVILSQINKDVEDQDTETPSTSFYPLIKRYPVLGKETSWLSEYSSAIVRYTLKGQPEAWQALDYVTILRSTISILINHLRLERFRSKRMMFTFKRSAG